MINKEFSWTLEAQEIVAKQAAALGVSPDRFLAALGQVMISQLADMSKTVDEQKTLVGRAMYEDGKDSEASGAAIHDLEIERRVLGKLGGGIKSSLPQVELATQASEEEQATEERPKLTVVEEAA